MASLSTPASPARWSGASAAAVLLPAGVALALFALVLFNPAVLNDPDTYWHLAAGEWMVAHGEILRHDVFSHTWAGRPWVSHEWLSEVAMALAYRAGGWGGLLVLTGAAVAAAFALLAQGLQRWLGATGVALALVLAFGLVGQSLLARPHLLVLPLLAGWMLELLAARRAGRAPALWLPLLMLLWANLHGSYAVGFVLMAPFALEALIAERRKPWPVIRGWGGVGLLCVAAAALTPHGAAGLIHPFTITSMSTLSHIVEWRPADFSRLGPFELALLGALFVCLSRGVRMAPLRLILLLALLHLALQHTRHQLVLAIAGPLLLAEPLAAALGREAAAQARRGGALAIALAGGLVLAGVRMAAPLTRTDGPETPAAALASVPRALAAEPVFNSYDFGGYLIFRGVRPFIDGRADMYGDAFFRRFDKAEQGGAAFDAAAARHDVAWTILKPGIPLARELDHKPGWRRHYADRYAVVHVRDGAAPAR